MVARPSRRDDLRRRLSGMLETCAAAGEGATIVVTGEAGIGKSTLVEHLVGAGRLAGMTTWVGRANEFDQLSPYSLISGVASADRGRLFEADVFVPDHAQRGPGGVMTSSATERFRVAEAVLEATEASFREPGVLVLEDVHWADAASLEAVATMARSCASVSLVLVVTKRPSLEGRLLDLDEALERQGALAVELGPLHPDEVTELLCELYGSAPSPELLARTRGAAGNPFLLCEYVGGLMEEAVGLSGDESGSAHDAPVPEQLRRSVATEVRRLGDLAAEVIRAAAVQGAFVDIDVLSAVTERSAVSLDDPLRHCVTAGLLEEHTDGWRFRHDLVRQAVYDDMPPPIRRSIHQLIANELAHRNAPAALVGSHLVLGDARGDDETIQRLHRAATETAMLAPDAAIEFLDRARDLATDDLAVRQVIERARLDALTAAGRIDEAQDTARWLLATADPAAKAEIHARLGGLASIAGQVSDSLENLRLAIELASDDRERSPILALAAITSATDFDYEAAERLATEAVELGGEVGEPIGHAAGLALLARMSTYDNTIVSGLQLGAQAVAIADTDPSGLAHEYLPCLHYGMTSFDADRLDVATAMAERGRRLASEHRMMWAAPLYGTLAAAVFFRRGEVDQAHAEAEASLELAERTNSRQTQLWTESLLCLASLELGDAEAASQWSQAARGSFESGRSSLGTDHLALALAKVVEREDGSSAALDSLRESWDLFEVTGLTFCQPLLAFDLARVARAEADDDLVDRVTLAVEAAARSNGVAAHLALGRWLRARTTADAASARRALDDLRATERRLEVAAWLADGAELLGDGDPTAALTEALAICEGLGAEGSAAVIRRRLDGSSVPASEPAGWHVLTTSEADIVQLLADGLTNAEIAQRRRSSRRTIESHLRQVYRKLGIDGRTRLVSAAASRYRN